ncbi:hypothetical protein BB560_000497 [Smittium megazygosporum]|uniref:Uncharacterized protein n=1 Tax=Smittium megazygosporum TaxID=133381 RepID=A0A2T9ZK39_9FUNG|nr:hypothetical protein BB560_000497 [Smittium megazygosporum]
MTFILKLNLSLKPSLSGMPHLHRNTASCILHDEKELKVESNSIIITHCNNPSTFIQLAILAQQYLKLTLTLPILNLLTFFILLLILVYVDCLRNDIPSSTVPTAISTAINQSRTIPSKFNPSIALPKLPSHPTATATIIITGLITRFGSALQVVSTIQRTTTATSISTASYNFY